MSEIELIEEDMKETGKQIKHLTERMNDALKLQAELIKKRNDILAKH
jgi:hypothetical protein